MNRVDRGTRARRVGELVAEPAVAQLPHPPQRTLRAAPDPDRQAPALRRLRLHADRRDLVVLPLEVDLGVAPVGAKQPDRLVHAGAAGAEALAERLVFRFLPADAHA